MSPPGTYLGFTDDISTGEKDSRAFEECNK